MFNQKKTIMQKVVRLQKRQRKNTSSRLHTLTLLDWTKSGTLIKAIEAKRAEDKQKAAKFEDYLTSKAKTAVRDAKKVVDHKSKEYTTKSGSVRPYLTDKWDIIAKEHGFENREAVRIWQKSQGLKDDGKLGKNSLNYLKAHPIQKLDTATLATSAVVPGFMRFLSSNYTPEQPAYLPGARPLDVIGEFANFNGTPAGALVERKIRGLIGSDVEHSGIPQDLRYVLSDINQDVFNNPAYYLSLNINKKQQDIANEKDPERKKSLKADLGRMNHLLELAKSGKLWDYYKEHPDEKFVLGINFAGYKRRNQSRFPKNTPDKYANFNYPGYADWAMSAPLGKVEATYGNHVGSFLYDPQTLTWITKASDSYDFNSHGSEKDSNIARLRHVAGNDSSIGENGKGGMRYSFRLRPIKEGESNYITEEQFGSNNNSEGKPTVANVLTNFGVGIMGGGWNGLANSIGIDREGVKSNIENLRKNLSNLY